MRIHLSLLCCNVAVNDALPIYQLQNRYTSRTGFKSHSLHVNFLPLCDFCFVMVLARVLVASVLMVQDKYI